MRQAIVAHAGLPAPARGPRQRARAAGALRGGGARASSRRSGSSRSCRSRTRSSARRSPRSAAAARPTSPSRSSSTATRHAARSRWRSITCGRAARTRPSRRCARPCAKTRTMSTRCACSRSSTGGRQAAFRRRGPAAPGHAARSPATRWPGRCSGGILQESNRHAEAMECYQAAIRDRPASAARLVGPRDRLFACRRRGQGASRRSSARSRCSRAMQTSS